MELSSHTYVDFYQFATIYAGLGERDEAFRLLEKDYTDHSSSMPYLTVDPFWHEMRSDARFSDLLRRMGLPKPLMKISSRSGKTPTPTSPF